MFHGGRKTPSKDEPSVVGLDRGSTFEGKASPGDVVLGVPAKGVQALQEDDGYEDEEQKNREPTKVIKVSIVRISLVSWLGFSFSFFKKRSFGWVIISPTPRTLMRRDLSSTFKLCSSGFVCV